MSSESNPYRAPLEATRKGAAPSEIGRARPKRGGATWLTAILLSAGAVYGPYLLMVIYTQLFVACDHCKEWSLRMFPISPGLVPMELFLRTARFVPPDSRAFFLYSGVFAVGWLLLLALVIRRWFWLGVVGVCLSLILGAVMAVMMLMMLRS
jgi:hypothetical protein